MSESPLKRPSKKQANIDSFNGNIVCMTIADFYIEIQIFCLRSPSVVIKQNNFYDKIASLFRVYMPWISLENVQRRRNRCWKISYH
jgi:hypothetical protein